jgi:hypothetical protein
MARLLLLGIIAIIALLIFLAKKGAGRVMGEDNPLNKTTFKDETGKVMDKTARGLNWMEKQWEESKKRAAEESDTKRLD